MKRLINHHSVIALLLIIIVSIATMGCSNQTAAQKEDTEVEAAEESAVTEEETVPEIKTISVTDIVTCKSIDNNSKPVDITDTFDKGTTIIHLTFNVHNFKTVDKIIVKWNYLESGEVIYTAETNPPEDGEFNNIEFYITYDKGLLSGKYNAEIYLNDELTETKEFSVK